MPGSVSIIKIPNMSRFMINYFSAICIFAIAITSCNNSSNSIKSSVDSTAKEVSSDPHGWIGTETVKSRLGDFEFKDGYPTNEAVKKLNDGLVYNRAIEVYLDQMHAVSWYNVWKGVAAAVLPVPIRW